MRKWLIIISGIFFYPIYHYGQKNISLKNNNENLNAISKEALLNSMLEKANEDTAKVNILLRLGLELNSISKNESAKTHIDSAKSLAKRLNYEKGLAACDLYEGIFWFQSGNYPKALSAFFAGLKISEKINYRVCAANCYVGISNIYSDSANSKKSLSYMQAAKHIYEEIGYKKELASSIDNIGAINQTIAKPKEAEKNYLIALKIKEELGDKRGMIWSYYHLGTLSLELDDAVVAEKYLLSALELIEETEDKMIQGSVLGGLADAYLLKKNYSKAEEFYKKSNLSAENTNDLEVKLDNELGLSNLYELKGEQKLALMHYKNYVSLKDSINNIEKTRKIVQLEMNYMFEKQLSIKRIEQNKKEVLANEKLKQQKYLTFYVAIVAILLIGLIMSLIWNHTRKIKAALVIAEQKQALSKQEARLDGQNEERKRLALELHDGIGGHLSAIKLNLENVASNLEPRSKEIEKIISNLYNACKEVRTISHNLAPDNLFAESFVPTLNELILQFNTSNTLQLQFDCFQEEELNKLNNNLKTDIYRIVQELCNNIIKHAKASRVDIGLFQENNYLNLSIEDNGIGFDINKKRSGIGLTNIESRVKLQNGSFKVDSKPGRGTAFIIRFPINEAK